MYGVYRRAAGIVLPGIGTSAKGGHYQESFYSRQIIKDKGKVNLLANRKVVMATIDGLLVLSSLRRGVNDSEDHTSSPFFILLTTWITIRPPFMTLRYLTFSYPYEENKTNIFRAGFLKPALILAPRIFYS